MIEITTTLFDSVNKKNWNLNRPNYFSNMFHTIDEGFNGVKACFIFDMENYLKRQSLIGSLINQNVLSNFTSIPHIEIYAVNDETKEERLIVSSGENKFKNILTIDNDNSYFQEIGLFPGGMRSFVFVDKKFIKNQKFYYKVKLQIEDKIESHLSNALDSAQDLLELYNNGGNNPEKIQKFKNDFMQLYEVDSIRYNAIKNFEFTRVKSIRETLEGLITMLSRVVSRLHKGGTRIHETIYDFVDDYVFFESYYDNGFSFITSNTKAFPIVSIQEAIESEKIKKFYIGRQKFVPQSNYNDFLLQIIMYNKHKISNIFGDLDYFYNRYFSEEKMAVVYNVKDNPKYNKEKSNADIDGDYKSSVKFNLDKSIIKPHLNTDYTMPRKLIEELIFNNEYSGANYFINKAKITVLYLEKNDNNFEWKKLTNDKIEFGKQILCKLSLSPLEENKKMNVLSKYFLIKG